MAWYWYIFWIIMILVIIETVHQKQRDAAKDRDDKRKADELRDAQLKYYKKEK